MFGEYGLYCNEHFIGMICDNQLFLKITSVNKSNTRLDRGFPYPGAKEWFVIDSFEEEDLVRLIQGILEEVQK